MKENRCKEHEETLHLYNTIFLSKTKTKSNIFFENSRRYISCNYPYKAAIKTAKVRERIENRTNSYIISRSCSYFYQQSYLSYP